jgi:hypothetical protein
MKPIEEKKIQFNLLKLKVSIERENGKTKGKMILEIFFKAKND